MIFKNIQGNWNLDIPVKSKRVAMKISGGADSAIVTYMLAKYKRDERHDITLIPVTTNAFPPKNWQVKYAKRVLRKITELTGVEFESHLTNEVTKEDAAEYLSTQSALEVNTKSLWDVKFDGVTRNPPQTETQFYTEGIEDSQRNEGSSWYNRTMYVDKDCLMPCYTPMRQYNKKGICDFYVQNNVLDNLFPVTRSCENSGNFKPIDHETHCEECWYCRERYWGFGRII